MQGLDISVYIFRFTERTELHYNLQNTYVNLHINCKSLCFELSSAWFYLFYLVSDILDYSNVIFPTDSTGAAFIPPVFKPKGIILFYFYFESTSIGRTAIGRAIN